MARIRTLKPSFFTSLTIGGIPLTARYTFMGLWTHADDEGRMVYEPRLFKAAIWPLDERSPDDIADDCAVLERAGQLEDKPGLVRHYIVAGRAYLDIPTWKEHQRINRPTPSTLPDPADGKVTPIRPPIRLLTSSDEHSVRMQ